MVLPCMHVICHVLFACCECLQFTWGSAVCISASSCQHSSCCCQQLQRVLHVLQQQAQAAPIVRLCHRPYGGTLSLLALMRGRRCPLMQSVAGDPKCLCCFWVCADSSCKRAVSEQAACMHLSLHACSCGVLGSSIGVASWHCDDGKQLSGTGSMGVTGRPAVHACAHHSSRFSLLLLRRRRAGSTPQCLKPAPSVHIMYRAVAIGWSALHPDGAETTHRACLLVSSGKKSTGSFSGDVFPALLVVWF